MFSQTVLIGRLGKDPEAREVGSTTVTSFSVATDYRYKNRDGEFVTKTEWHNIKVWAASAKACAQYLKKGSLVQVVGRIETESWEDKSSGEKKYKTTIVADTVNFLDSKSSSGQDTETPAKSKSARPVTKADPISDEDLPF